MLIINRTISCVGDDANIVIVLVVNRPLIVLRILNCNMTFSVKVNCVCQLYMSVRWLFYVLARISCLCSTTTHSLWESEHLFLPFHEGEGDFQMTLILETALSCGNYERFRKGRLTLCFSINSLEMWLYSSTFLKGGKVCPGHFISLCCVCFNGSQ